GIGQFDPGTDTVEQRRRHDVIAVSRVAVADTPDIGRDAEDFLQEDDSAARRFVRPRLVGAQAVAVAGIERDGLRTHEATWELSEISTIFENILTYRKSECYTFVAGKSANLQKVCRAICVCAFRTGGRGPAGAAWRHVTMDSGAFPLKSEYPVTIVGAGPVGLTTALALSYYEIPFVV